MLGINTSKASILSNLKEAQLITFQCSPLSTSDMILKEFRLVSLYQLQRHHELDRYAAVLVLDEIGLAEASPHMPLKALHSVLEEGVHFDDKSQSLVIEMADRLGYKENKMNDINNDWKKVGFIGISNWVLDPAKMNRGIFVNRFSPSTDELVEIAEGICKQDQNVSNSLTKYIRPISEAYQNICNATIAADEIKREFFGLRDFYCFIKMMYWELKRPERKGQMDDSFFEKAIKRNFGGLEEVNAIKHFADSLQKAKIPIKFASAKTDLICLMREALTKDINKKSVQDENRYLLLISEIEHGLDFLNTHVFDQKEFKNISVIFGSSFRNDQHYSQLCRQMRQIKISMELGRTVILINLESLYESLYDALNQFYTKFGDNQKFTDLGLGTQRVTCLVHEDFRLIIVAPKEKVYSPKIFPIPLVNRLEKYLLSLKSIINSKHRIIIEAIEKWCEMIIDYSSDTNNRINRNKLDFYKQMPSDVFIGYTHEILAALVLKYSKYEDNDYEKVVDEYEYEWQESEQIKIKIKNQLLQCSTTDCIMRLDKHSYKNNEIKDVCKTYFEKQNHDSFQSFVEAFFQDQDKTTPHFIQITTHSKLLSRSDLKKLSETYTITFESLLEFNTKQAFINALRKFYDTEGNKNKRLLIIQCDHVNHYKELVSCARHCIFEEFINTKKEETINDAYVFLLLQVPKKLGEKFYGFQVSNWLCYHIDDLKDEYTIGSVYSYKDKTLAQIFEKATEEANKKEPEVQIKFLKLLESSIYFSCSRIIDVLKTRKENENNPQTLPRNTRNKEDRSIKRIRILEKLLIKNELPRFSTMLFKYITKLQKERQDYSTDNSSRWLLNEVAGQANVIKYGTLKQSFKIHIETALSFLLSGLIAFFDINNNLDTLINIENSNLLMNDANKWKQNFWLDIFENTSLISISYKEHFLQFGGQDKREFYCINHLTNKILINPQLPFFWILKQIIDDSIDQQRLNERNQFYEKKYNNRVEQIKRFSGEKFQELEKLLRKYDEQNYLKLYYHDYVTMKYAKFHNDCELQCVIKRLEKYMEFNCGIMTGLDKIIMFHFAYEELNNELDMFSKFVILDPNITVSLINKDSDFSIGLNFLCSSQFCIDRMNAVDPPVSRSDGTTDEIIKVPKAMDAKDWNVWYDTVSKGSLLIQNVTQSVDESNSNNNTIKQLISLWQLISTTSLFIKHVCIKNQDYNKDANFMYDNCKRLWNRFKGAGSNPSQTGNAIKLDYHTIDSVEQIEKVIDLIHKNRRMHFEKNAVKCKLCSLIFTKKYHVLENCIKKCAFCKRCKIEIESANKCSCGQDIPGQKIFIEENKNFESYDQLKAFRTSLNYFYLEIVSTLCLKNGQIPEHLVPVILKWVFPKTIEQWNSTSENDRNLEYNVASSVKFNLLQIVLQSNSKLILTREFTNVLKNWRQYNVKTLVDMNQIYINAYESYLHQNYGLSSSNKNSYLTVFEFLNDLKNIQNSMNYQDNDSHIKKLTSIAEIKFCMFYVSQIIASETDMDANLIDRLLNATQDFLKKQNSEWPRFFLIKNIYRRYGRFKLSSIKNDRKLSWIMETNLNYNENVSLYHVYVLTLIN